MLNNMILNNIKGNFYLFHLLRPVTSSKLYLSKPYITVHRSPKKMLQGKGKGQIRKAGFNLIITELPFC